jgi:hypothetical protein
MAAIETRAAIEVISTAEATVSAGKLMAVNERSAIRVVDVMA